MLKLDNNFKIIISRIKDRMIYLSKSNIFLPKILNKDKIKMTKKNVCQFIYFKPNTLVYLIFNPMNWLKIYQQKYIHQIISLLLSWGFWKQPLYSKVCYILPFSYFTCGISICYCCCNSIIINCRVAYRTDPADNFA